MASKKTNRERKMLHGYNPVTYRAMTTLFVLLSILNAIAVLFSFMRSGFGLYHAEDALSHVAMLNHHLHTINEAALDIVIHCDDVSEINNGSNAIKESFNVITSESQLYTAIDLMQIDSNLQSDFEDASHKVRRYNLALTEFISTLQSNIEKGSSEVPTYHSYIEWKYTDNIEPLKDDAEEAINRLFNYQCKATYDFFVRCAQQFLFVLLFMAITMTVGLTGIAKMKKNAKTAAEQAEQERVKAELSRAKSVNIAYSNILTGFKNRYGLEMDLENMLSSSSFTIALYRLVNFQNIAEKYGRNVADDYVVKVSQVLQQNYGTTSDIYSTETDEFCFVFKNDLLAAHEKEIMVQIGHAVSRLTDVDGIQIQSVSAGCYYHCQAGTHQSCNSLLHTLDKGMSVARRQCFESGKNAVISVSSQ